jgi:mannose-1-phosphate guanylyltransferase
MTRKPSVGKLWGIVLAGGEGTRVRHFLQRLCGNRGIKQFCALVDSRSMLEHTLARVERLIPRRRILVVVSREHRQEVTEQLAHWPTDNVIFQPANCETGPGILLPLAHLSQRDPLATVAVFPSDHFIKDEDRFATCLQNAITETKRFPEELMLLGVTPDKAEEGYGWIEPRGMVASWVSRRVKRFWEKPSSMQARTLLKRGALWNTFVFFTRAATLWQMVRQAAPDLYEAFVKIRRALGNLQAEQVTENVYATLRSANFSSEICEPSSARLRVFPVPEVGWSDWGSVERILTSLKQMGKLEETVARAATIAKERDVTPTWC